MEVRSAANGAAFDLPLEGEVKTTLRHSYPARFGMLPSPQTAVTHTAGRRWGPGATPSTPGRSRTARRRTPTHPPRPAPPPATAPCATSGVPPPATTRRGRAARPPHRRAGTAERLPRETAG